MSEANDVTVDAAAPKQRGKGDILMVGVDDGYAVTKVALQNGRTFQIPSRARAGVNGLTSFSSGASAEIDGGYEADGQSFTVSPLVEGEGTRFDEYPYSPLNRVVIHHALRTAGLAGKRIQVATGLPVSHFFSGSQPNMEVIRRKKESVKKPVTALSGDACAEITSSHVFAEGVVAWIDHAIDQKGQVIGNMAATAAIVDIGGRTTDCVLVLDGCKVDHARSGTGEIGVLKFQDVIADGIRRKFSVPDVPVAALEAAVRTGHIRRFGKDVDISDIVDKARKEVGDQILREVSRRIGSGADLECVLFVGGGARIFTDVIDAFPNSAVKPEPEFANARGLLKYMLYVK
jgi:plasmid segregation protein ParM